MPKIRAGHVAGLRCSISTASTSRRTAGRSVVPPRGVVTSPAPPKCGVRVLEIRARLLQTGEHLPPHSLALSRFCGRLVDPQQVLEGGDLSGRPCYRALVPRIQVVLV